MNEPSSKFPAQSWEKTALAASAVSTGWALGRGKPLGFVAGLAAAASEQAAGKVERRSTNPTLPQTPIYPPASDATPSLDPFLAAPSVGAAPSSPSAAGAQSADFGPDLMSLPPRPLEDPVNLDLLGPPRAEDFAPKSENWEKAASSLAETVKSLAVSPTRVPGAPTLAPFPDLALQLPPIPSPSNAAAAAPPANVLEFEQKVNPPFSRPFIWEHNQEVHTFSEAWCETVWFGLPHLPPLPVFEIPSTLPPLPTPSTADVLAAHSPFADAPRFSAALPQAPPPPAHGNQGALPMQSPRVVPAPVLDPARQIPPSFPGVAAQTTPPANTQSPALPSEPAAAPAPDNAALASLMNALQGRAEEPASPAPAEPLAPAPSVYVSPFSLNTPPVAAPAEGQRPAIQESPTPLDDLLRQPKEPLPVPSLHPVQYVEAVLSKPTAASTLPLPRAEGVPPRTLLDGLPSTRSQYVAAQPPDPHLNSPPEAPPLPPVTRFVPLIPQSTANLDDHRPYRFRWSMAVGALGMFLLLAVGAMMLHYSTNGEVWDKHQWQQWLMLEQRPPTSVGHPQPPPPTVTQLTQSSS